MRYERICIVRASGEYKDGYYGDNRSIGAELITGYVTQYLNAKSLRLCFIPSVYLRQTQLDRLDVECIARIFFPV